MENFILSVEDNPDDILLFGMAFRKAKFSVRVEFLTDGEKAIEYFAPQAAKPLPLLVLLDLKLPRKSGLDVLAWLRSQRQPLVKHLPVVMLTSSNDPADIECAYDLGINSYLVKPTNIDNLVELIKAIDTYWIKSNIHPGMPLSATDTAIAAASMTFATVSERSGEPRVFI